jgi:hypothetical protein
MSRKGITPKQFNAVDRAIKAGKTEEDIAARIGLKPSTVRAIRQAGSYSEYEQRRTDKSLKAAAKRTSAEVRELKKASKKGVAPRQAKTGVTEEPVSAYMLNEAYKEVIALKTELLGKVTDAQDTAYEANLNARKAVKAVAEIQQAEARAAVQKPKSRLPWRRG